MNALLATDKDRKQAIAYLERLDCDGCDPPISAVDDLPNCADCRRHAARLPDLYQREQPKPAPIAKQEELQL